MDINVLFKLSYGMYIVGAFAEGRPVGCVVNTCFQVTNLDPLLVISLNKNTIPLRLYSRTNGSLCRFLLRIPIRGLLAPSAFYAAAQLTNTKISAMISLTMYHASKGALQDALFSRLRSLSTAEPMSSLSDALWMPYREKAHQ